jgi:hypothetical protein
MTSRQHPSPAEVLAILVDEHRHQSQVDPEAEKEAVLTFDSSIADWRFACDLVDWTSLGRALNKEWGISLSMDEWREVLEPPDKRTLRTLCDRISREAEIERLPRCGLLGCTSPEGRALRALRALLLQLGTPREEIRPSTLLTPLLTRYRWRLLSPCVRLAPGALPAMKHVGTMHRILWATMALLLIAGAVLAAFGSRLGAWGLCLGLLMFVAQWIPLPIFQGSLVLPGVATLGDLAACISKGMGGEQGASPNGGPAEPLGNSGVSGGPPSVS